MCCASRRASNTNAGWSRVRRGATAFARHCPRTGWRAIVPAPVWRRRPTTTRSCVRWAARRRWSRRIAVDMPHRGAVRLEARGERAWITRRHRPQSDDCVRFERFREMVGERAHARAHIVSRRIDDKEAGFRSRFAACFHFDQRVSRDVVLAQMRRQRGLARAAQRELSEQCEAVRPCGTTVSFARWRRCRCRTHSPPCGACARNTARRSSGFKAFRRASGARSRDPLRRRYRAPCVRGAPRCRAAHACADARAR